METQSLASEFLHISRRFRKLHLVETFDGVTQGEFVAMRTLSWHRATHPDAKGMYVSALAEKIHVSASAVSRMLRALEAKGYIERQVDQEDRRNTYILLTEEGERVMARVREELRTILAHVFDQMGEPAVRQFMALWKQFIGIMEREIDDLDKGDRACSKY